MSVRSKYTASLTSSVREYRHENGRTYHGYRDGCKYFYMRDSTFKNESILLMRKAYLLPNDENEKDRLDIMHELMLTMMDRKLFLAPINSSVGRVLDLGTGTGVWAIDFGEAAITLNISFF